MKTVWNFVEEYYPKYSSSQAIADNNDLSLASEELPNCQVIKEALQLSNAIIYEKAIEGYLKQIDNN